MSNNVLVIGAVNIDIFASTKEEYTLEDSNMSDISLGFGGVGGNIATNLNTLGCSVSFMTVYGNEILGTMIYNHYQTLGIDVSHSFQSTDKDASVYLAILDQRNDLFLGLNDMSIINELDPDFIRSELDYIHQFDIIVVDNNLSPETLEYILKTFQEKTIVMDAVSAKKVTKLKPLLPYISVLKVNKLELSTLSDKDTIEAQINDVTEQGVKELLVTNKEESVLYSLNGQTTMHKTLPCDHIVNATGAGDAFISAFTYGIIKKYNVEEKMALAMRFARDTLNVHTSTIEKGDFHV